MYTLRIIGLCSISSWGTSNVQYKSTLIALKKGPLYGRLAQDEQLQT